MKHEWSLIAARLHAAGAVTDFSVVTVDNAAPDRPYIISRSAFPHQSIPPYPSSPRCQSGLIAALWFLWALSIIFTYLFSSVDITAEREETERTRARRRTRLKKKSEKKKKKKRHVDQIINHSRCLIIQGNV